MPTTACPSDLITTSAECSCNGMIHTGSGTCVEYNYDSYGDRSSTCSECYSGARCDSDYFLYFDTVSEELSCSGLGYYC